MPLSCFLKNNLSATFQNQTISALKKFYGKLYHRDLNSEHIERPRETDVEAMVAPVIRHARKELDNLTDYGITEAMITEVETSLDEFKALIGLPRTIRNQAFAAMTLLDELFDAANDLFKNRLDPLMIRFRFSDTEFYSEYERARTIVD